MMVFKSKAAELPGTSHAVVTKLARKEYHKIQKRTPRRQTYVRSSYFSKDKVFMNTFWAHNQQKHPGDRVRRLKFYNCAIDLIRNSTIDPETILSDNDKNLLLHRFYGKTTNNKLFCVQIKENKRTGRKELMSVFPGRTQGK